MIDIYDRLGLIYLLLATLETSLKHLLFGFGMKRCILRLKTGIKVNDTHKSTVQHPESRVVTIIDISDYRDVQDS